MNPNNERTCDRCESTVVMAVPRPATNYEITISGENPREYVAHSRYLCPDCERKLLEWIDGEEGDHADRVQLPYAGNVAQTLDEIGIELTELADDLRDVDEQSE